MSAGHAGRKPLDLKLSERLARTEASETWRATCADRSQSAIVRRLLKARPTAAAILEQAAGLSHPCLAPCLGFIDEAQPSIAFEELPGPSLRALIAEGGLGDDDQVEVLRRLAQALAVIHEAGLAHGAVHIDNLRGSPKALRLTDLGVAAALERDPYQDRERLDSVAPELRRENAAPTAKGDIYAFGVLLFELTTQGRPAGGELPSERRPEIAPWIDVLFQRCYAPQGRRLADGAAVLDFIDTQSGQFGEASAPAGEAVGSPVEPRAEASAPIKLSRNPAIIGAREPWTPSQPRSRRGRRIAAALTGVALLAGVGAAAYQWASEEPIICFEPVLSFNELLAKGERLYHIGQYDEALRYAERARSFDAERGASFDLGGRARVQLGQLKEAIADFDRAIALREAQLQSLKLRLATNSSSLRVRGVDDLRLPELYRARASARVYLLDGHNAGARDQQRSAEQRALALRDYEYYLAARPLAADAPEVAGWIARLKGSEAR